MLMTVLQLRKRSTISAGIVCHYIADSLMSNPFGGLTPNYKA